MRIPSLDTPSAFRSYFVTPIETGRRQGFDNLRSLLKCICIRRTKDLLQIPEPQTVEYKLHLSHSEHSLYSQVGESYRKAIDDAVSGRSRKVPEAYRSIFQALLKLRILCNHGMLEPVRITSVIDAYDESLTPLQVYTTSCAYCDEDVIYNGVEGGSIAGRLPACSHFVCEECIQQYQEDLAMLDEGFEIACPLCKVPLIKDIRESKERAFANEFHVGYIICRICRFCLERTPCTSSKYSQLLIDCNERAAQVVESFLDLRRVSANVCRSWAFVQNAVSCAVILGMSTAGYASQPPVSNALIERLITALENDEKEAQWRDDDTNLRTSGPYSRALVALRSVYAKGASDEL
jgi:hypothetical protein